MVLFFQGWDDPYVPRTHEGLLKWKYAAMNSVDFLFEVVLTSLYLTTIVLSVYHFYFPLPIDHNVMINSALPIVLTDG